MQVEIDFAKISDWDSFHASFKKAMGFPDFYGSNNDAWIDCMSYIDDPGSGMSTITVAPGEALDILVKGTSEAAKRCPDILLGFLEIASFVNQRFVEAGTETRLRVTAT